MVISEKMKNIIEWIICILLAFVLALVIKHFLFTPTVVQQVSMNPTLKHNDRLLLNRWDITINKEMKRGEIITFEAPSKKNITLEEIDLNNPVAIYNNNVHGAFSSFLYYVLEISKESYIKRIIGLPGEHIFISQDGDVYVNDHKLEEEYLPEGLQTERTGEFYDFIVPENYLFVMGDNRAHSDDSRRFGCIPINKVEGKVMCRFWPLNSIGSVE